ncbi:hypothetical protein QFZ94_000268 [Paraburkholderia sp. JPY465]|uniref:Ulp1 family isopeptidase n=1 Tax=Paraburkholderia sp. JPY465 TaxID=3042285 RepID=UPI003D24C5EB
MQGLNDLQLEGGSRTAEPVVYRISYAKKTVIYNQEDEEFVANFIAFMKGREKTNVGVIAVYADALARLSHACPGFSGRLDAPQLDEVALRIDPRGLVHGALVRARQFRADAPHHEDQAIIDFIANSHVSRCTSAVRKFSAWLRCNDLPPISGRIAALDNDMGRYLADARLKGERLERGIRALRNAMKSSESLRNAMKSSESLRNAMKSSELYEEDAALASTFADHARLDYAERTTYIYKGAIEAFSRWLKKNNLPPIYGRLGPDEIDRLRKDLERCRWEGVKSTQRSKQAIDALVRMGLGQQEKSVQRAGSPPPFSNASSRSWPDWDEGGPPSTNQPYGHGGFGTPESDFFTGLPWEQPQTPGRGAGVWEAYNRPQESGSTYAGLSSLRYAGPYGNREFDPNTPQSVVGPAQPSGWGAGVEEAYNRPQESSSTYAGLSSLVYGVAYGNREFDPDTPQSVVGPSHVADPEIVEVDNYPSPQAPISGVAQRLAEEDSWLHDIDFYHYSQVLAQELHGQHNAHLLGFIDPQQVRLLTEGTPRQQEAVRERIAGPQILFLPVNVGDLHWSLLVVNRGTRQAFHYDSAVPPQHAHRATNTPQFQQAARVATALGVGTPMGMPTALQPDNNTCGDHVLYGMETLARRVISEEVFRHPGMDLSTIEPDRQHVINVLTQAERFRAEIAQPRQVPGGSDLPAPGAYPDLSYHVGGNWQHGNQRASPLVMNIMENHGLMPSPYVPQTYMLIHDQRYMATLHGNEVWLTQTLNLG